MGLFFLKPTHESSGIGVRKYRAEGSNDWSHIFGECKGKGFILEQEIRLCDELRRLNPKGTSEIRIVTVTGKKGVNILSASLRTSIENEINFVADEIVVQLDIITGKCTADGVDASGNVYKAHPVSKIVFEEY